MECSTWWSQLPDDLKENVLAWLPAESLCRYRSVSKEWNALFSSTKFITNHWVAAPPNRNPWLLLCHEHLSLSLCTAYCFFTNTWKRFSLAFLRQKHKFYGTWNHESAAGLFLASVSPPRELHSAVIHIVSNPLTGTSLELPELPRIDDITGRIAMTLVAAEGQGHNGETYKVISVAEAGNEEIVEIYDSRLKSWSTAGRLPQNLNVLMTPNSMRMVFSEELLYCNGTELNSSREGIVAFNLQNGTSIFMPLPVLLEAVDRYDNLFSCGSRVLLATCIYGLDDDMVMDIIISEIQKPVLGSNYSEFREIARIPPSLLEDLKIEERFHSGTFIISF